MGDKEGDGDTDRHFQGESSKRGGQRNKRGSKQSPSCQPGRRTGYARDKLKCMYTNADSLLNKRAEFLSVIHCDNPNIICVTLTEVLVLPKKKKIEVQSSELKLDNYDCFTNCDVHVQGVRGVVL